MSLVNQLKIGSSIVLIESNEPLRVLDEITANASKPVFRFGFQDRLTRWDPEREDWYFCLFDMPNEDDKVTVNLNDHLLFILNYLRETNGILVFPNVNDIAKAMGSIFFEYCLSFRTALKQNNSSKYRHQICLYFK